MQLSEVARGTKGQGERHSMAHGWGLRYPSEEEPQSREQRPIQLEMGKGRRERAHPGCSNMGGPEDICIANESDSVEMGETGSIRTRRTAEARP